MREHDGAEEGSATNDTHRRSSHGDESKKFHSQFPGNKKPSTKTTGRRQFGDSHTTHTSTQRPQQERGESGAPPPFRRPCLPLPPSLLSSSSASLPPR